MKLLRITFILLALTVVSIHSLRAQCYGNAQAESFTCGTTPRTLSAFSTCGNCTHNWYPAPQSGQGTSTATYVYSPGQGFGHLVQMPSVTSYNPNVPCNYGDQWQVGVGLQPNIALPALANGPWNGDTSKTWIYARSYLNPAPTVMGQYSFTPSWTVTGGSMQLTRHLLTGFYYYDSVFVRWNGSGPMLIHEAQVTSHTPQNMISNFFCNWNATPSQQLGHPSLAVFYNGGVCQGGTKTFFTFPYNNSTYTWSVSNGTVVSGQGTNSAQIQINGAATVTVVRDSVGNQTTANTTVTPIIAAINLGPDQTVCQGTPVPLNAGPGFTQYVWSTGATSQTIVATSPGQYRVTASINGACYAYDTIQISSLPITQVNLGPDVNTCTFPVTLNAGPGFTTYQWSTGATTPTISAATAGIYRVTVTNSNGCTDADTILVNNRQTTVNMATSASFCHPGSFFLLPNYTNAGIYLWSTGATTSSISVTGAGAQTLWVQASNIYGCQASDTITVTGVPRPVPNLGPDQTVCPGTAVTLDGGPGFTTYQWSNFQSSRFITVTTPGNYRVTVTDGTGCAGSDTVTVSNYAFSNPNLGPDINVCQASATLNAGAGYTTYLWSTGATTQTISVSSGGTYSVTVTDINGCAGSDAINATFNNIVMSLGPDVNVCEPQQVILDPQLLGAFTYNWSTGAVSPTVTLSAPGSYTVRLTLSNTFGCTASDTVSVSILPTPSIFLGNDTIICADTSLTLDAGSAFVSYAWNTGATTQTIAANDGHYEVAATAANGCIARDSFNLSGLIDCVFPGDINYDLSVDLMDVLAMGPAMGMSGSARPNASLNWYGQACQNWLWNVTSGVNAKQADTDGNGLVDADDTLAVQLNFGNTHSRIGTVATGPSQLRIVPMSTNVLAGDIAYFGVYYEGAAATALDSVHGLAMQLSWPSTGLSNRGLIAVDYSNTWFAPSGNHLDFTRTSINSAHLAITRTSGIDTSGQGLVMLLAFETDSNMAPGNALSFAPLVVASTGVSADLVPTNPQSSVTPITISGMVAVGTHILTHVSIMPIPANDQLKVLVEGQVADGKIQLVNMLGQVLVDIPVDANQWHVLSTAQFPNGAYGVRVQTSQGMFFRQVVIQH